MKEYEKLAEDYVFRSIEIPIRENFGAIKGFEAGFLKAREMALDIVNDKHDLECAYIIEKIKSLGEKEV